MLKGLILRRVRVSAFHLLERWLSVHIVYNIYIIIITYTMGKVLSMH